MDNPRFVNDENIPLLHDKDRGNDYYDYNTPDTSNIQETTITDPDTTETTLNLRLRQKVKRDKLAALHRHLIITSDPDLADVDRFMCIKISKKVNTELLFLTVSTGNHLLINVLVNF